VRLARPEEESSVRIGSRGVSIPFLPLFCGQASLFWKSGFCRLSASATLSLYFGSSPSGRKEEVSAYSLVIANRRRGVLERKPVGKQP